MKILLRLTLALFFISPATYAEEEWKITEALSCWDYRYSQEANPNYFRLFRALSQRTGAKRLISGGIFSSPRGLDEAEFISHNVVRFGKRGLMLSWMEGWNQPYAVFIPFSEFSGESIRLQVETYVNGRRFQSYPMECAPYPNSDGKKVPILDWMQEI